MDQRVPRQDEDTKVSQHLRHGSPPYARFYYTQVTCILTDWIRPIVALIAGIHEAPGRIMGHAGAFTIPGEPDAKIKIAALEAAGVSIVNHPSRFGEALKARLQGTPLAGDGLPSGNAPHVSAGGTQRRLMHTSARRVRHDAARAAFRAEQRRNISLSDEKSMDLLRAHGTVNCGPYSGRGERRYLALGIDRSTRSPCIIAAPAIDGDGGGFASATRRFPFDYRRGVDELVVERVAAHLGFSSKTATVDSLRRVLRALSDIFYGKEAYLVETHLVERLGEVKVVGAHFGFDDAAFRSGGRQGDVQALREVAREDAAELEAERSGIVYIKLAGDGAIGTLVNGAGLAMNTVDALADAGGRAANFLDTGGKATSETVKHGFEVILRDPRVRVIFVNIFGGLTLGDMIARGVILAFQELSPRVPVVVRIRGTKEEEGQKLIADSGLPLYAFDDFDEAAAKAIELSAL